MNQLQEIRDKWARGEVCIGTNVTLTDSTVVELLGEVGFDIVWIDMEHSAMTLDHCLNHVRTCRGVGMAPFIRVPSNDPVVVKPFLEMHPAGIIMPRISNVTDAEQAVRSCRYPPRGVRGFGPIRGVRFSARDTEDYLAKVDAEILVILQIEHIDAVNQIEEILRIPGRGQHRPRPDGPVRHDGPAGAARAPPTWSPPSRGCSTRRAPPGVPMGQSIGPDPKALRHWIDGGVSWICSGGDWHLLYPAARELHELMSSMT